MRLPFACLLALSTAVHAASAQDFRPPDPRRPADSTRPPAAAPPQAQATAPPAAESNGFHFGIQGFSTRAGAQVTQEGQAIIGTTVDIARLGSPRVRLRPSAEVGFGRPERSLGASLEVVFRFQPETADAIPYVGAGVGYEDDGSVERVWPTFVLGFELPFQRHMRWLVEYHGLDGLRRSRFLVGLAASAGAQ
jgi:hypothetical protein